jgi:hypothetical protein
MCRPRSDTACRSPECDEAIRQLGAGALLIRLCANCLDMTIAFLRICSQEAAGWLTVVVRPQVVKTYVWIELFAGVKVNIRCGAGLAIVSPNES